MATDEQPRAATPPGDPSEARHGGAGWGTVGPKSPACCVVYRWRGGTRRWPPAGAKWRTRLSKEGCRFCARGHVLRVRVGAVLVRDGAGANVLL